MENEIICQTEQAVRELLSVAKLGAGALLVVGCSTSEIAGGKIGKASVPSIGGDVFNCIAKLADTYGISLAAQCCEHLNRALIVERKTADALQLEIVSVIPAINAGGSFATAAFAAMKDPVAVESVKAEAGIDIGDTLIGMHLKPVAVPVRVSVTHIGNARVVCAITRPKYIGGSRACY